MKYGINTLDDFDFGSKIVLCRLDLNCPYNRGKGTLKDINRIRAAIPTIKELSSKGAKLVLLAHQGSDLEYHNYISIRMHSEELSKLLGKNVEFIDDICGPAARDAIKKLESGKILLLDNVRYMAEEMTIFETKLKLTPEEQAKTIVVSKLSPLADFFVYDAFAAAHRSQPSLVGFEELLPSAMGRLFEKEYSVLSKIMTSPEKPCIFLLGGAKIEDAFTMMPTVFKNDIADRILCAGLLAQVFMIASGIDIGASSKELIYKKKLDTYIEKAKDILSNYRDKIIMPADYAYLDKGRVEVNAEDLPTKNLISDIGTKTISAYKGEISKAKTVFVNGPPGIFEERDSELGTKELLSYIASNDSFSVIGGGDSVAAASKYRLTEKFSYVCTGGGAMIRFLSGEELPVVKALKKSAKKFK